MKKKQLQLLKDIGIYILTIVMCSFLVYVGYLIYTSYHDGSITIEHLAEKFAQEHLGEKYSHSSPISEERGIAFFGYNCENTVVWKCHGE
ncbi:hypothetical protein HZC32_02285, partial [Candidatus Woesearchaeota archaeon]|nr:hypothetical protein [Candidatus Woesearchaeota archaeon]